MTPLLLATNILTPSKCHLWPLHICLTFVSIFDFYTYVRLLAAAAIKKEQERSEEKARVDERIRALEGEPP